MDKSDADILSRHLEPGEKVVWIGRPSDSCLFSIYGTERVLLCIRSLP